MCLYFCLSYPPCTVHAPYCRMWSVPLYSIFSTLSHKRHDFQEKPIEHKMCILIFSTNFIGNNSPFEENSAKYYHKYTNVFK